MSKYYYHVEGYNQALDDVIKLLKGTSEDFQEIHDRLNNRAAYTLSEAEKLSKHASKEKAQLLLGQIRHIEGLRKT